MDVVVITGSCGLIGSEAVEFFAQKGFQVVGIDNNMRGYFFGKEGSVQWNQERLEKKVESYIHKDIDIRNEKDVENIFKEFNLDIKLVVHTAAQPSHDWAANEPFTDFTINANGTLILLEMARRHCPETVFIFTSTNKVYGDLPNSLPLVEFEKRWDLPEDHDSYNGIDEKMSIDQSKHSLFGASKVAGDILVQEYGRYFGMKTAAFRGGCLTGPHHSGAELHGFLSYLMKCCMTGTEYHIYGYKGKQVRDNIHSSDLVNAFYCFYQNPKKGEVYNIGGGRPNSCSILEAIDICENVSGKKMKYKYQDENRSGDHIWYISDLSKFQSHYPEWTQKNALHQTIEEIFKSLPL